MGMQTELKFNKKVLAVLLEWDYGIKERGESLEKKCFLPALCTLVSSVEVLWYDNLLGDTRSLQKAILDRAEKVKPDLVFFIPFQEEISIQTLDALKKSFATYAWFGDDQWRFEKFTSLYAPHYTFVSTTDPWSLQKYKKIGIRPILTQWAGQVYSENIGPITDNNQFKHDLSFVGGCNPYRKWFIERLAKKEIHADCYGAGWPNGRIGYKAMEQVFRTSKVNLNISNSISHDARFIFSGIRSAINYMCTPKRAEQPKARNFEIPMAGGFQLTGYFAGLERYLRLGEEVAAYSTFDECFSLINYYLQADSERIEIVQKGFARCIKEHTYSARLKHILNSIWNT